MLFRETVKLYLDRQRNREGSRIPIEAGVRRARAEPAPVVFLVLFSFAVLNRNLDKWFRRAGGRDEHPVARRGSRTREEVQSRADALALWLARFPT